MLSNYPDGFSNGVLLREWLADRPQPRKNLYVGNNGTLLPREQTVLDDPNHGTFLKPYATLDYAVGKAKAGDTIWVRPGHTETVVAAGGLDLDVAGITIVFLGEGNARGSITFGTAVTADMDIDAADITLINPRFIAALDALTGPIDVNSARFKMINATWQDGTSINTTDCLVADANADDMVIDGFEFIDGDAGGTQKQSFIQVAGATRPTIRNIKCTGDFGTGIIENGTAWVDAWLENLVLDNASASPTVCVLLQATSSGWMRNSSLRVASGLTGYTANNDMQFNNVRVVGTDAASAEGGDGTIGTKADSAATGAVTTTDTLMAYIKQLVTQNGTELDTDTLGALLSGTGGITTMPNAAVPANNINVFELLRSIWGNQCGTAAGENGIATFPSAAVPGNNVSIAEVLRDTWDALRNGTGGTEPGTNKSLFDELRSGGFSKDSSQYFTVTADFTSATWKTVASHEIGTVTGLCRVRILPEIVASIGNDSNTAKISLGTDATAAAFIAATTATVLDTDEIWQSSTGSENLKSICLSGREATAGTRIVDAIVNGVDVGYTIATTATTAGSIKFHVYWEALETGASVAAGAGGTL